MTWDESQHPRAQDGKFGAGGGPSGKAKASPDAAKANASKIIESAKVKAAQVRWQANHDKAAQHARATSAVSDPQFTTAHAKRLELADQEARSNFPRDPHGEEADRAAANWKHAEAMRIHAEHDAIGGDHRREELAEVARIRAHYDGLGSVGQHEHAMAALAEDHSAGLEERRAVLAGHVTDVPHAKHDEYLATRQQVRHEIASRHEDLDRAHEEAESALERLRAVDINGHDGWERKMEDVDIENLTDHFSATSTYLAESGGGTAREFGGNRHDVIDMPERDGHSTEHDYNNAIAAHENTFKQRAWLAQSALERLHAQQISLSLELGEADLKHAKAHRSSMKEVDNLDEHDLVNHKAFVDYERDQDGDIVDAIGASHLARANAASARRVSKAQTEREYAAIGDLADARQSLHEETKWTRDAVRALAKITLRPPKLGKRPPKRQRGS